MVIYLIMSVERYTDCDLSYLAGMLDAGRGHIGVHKHKAAETIEIERKFTYTSRFFYKKRDVYRYYPYVAVQFSSTPQLLEWLRERFGEDCEISIDNAKKHKADVFRFGSNVLREVLPRLIPHLQVRKTQAQLVLHALNNDACEELYKRDKNLRYY